MWAAVTTSTRWIGPVSLMLCSAGAATMRLRMSIRSRGMSIPKGSSFTAGLVQMRSGLSPQANLDAAARLIVEARDRGADYVLTPEMTNILEVKRERLFAAIVPEESVASLAAFRELARTLRIFLHVGSLAIKLSPERAANRSFLIDRDGEILARYDKIHMFDVDL